MLKNPYMFGWNYQGAQIQTIMSADERFMALQEQAAMNPSLSNLDSLQNSLLR